MAHGMKSLPMSRYAGTIGAMAENMITKEAVNPFYASYKVTNVSKLSWPSSMLM